MLCGSSVACAAPTVSTLKKIQKGQVCHSSYKSDFMAWNFEKKKNVVCHSSYKSDFMAWNFEKKKNVVQCSALLTCFLV